MEQEKPAAPPVIPPVPKSFKLLGQNYVTPDLVAKVTGRANTPKTIAQKAWCSSS